MSDSWWKTVKVGDIVNTCEYLNLRIVSIKDHKDPETGEVFSRTATFSDGHSCSIDACCQPPMTNDEIEKEISEYFETDMSDSLGTIFNNPHHIKID